MDMRSGPNELYRPLCTICIRKASTRIRPQTGHPGQHQQYLVKST